MKAIFDFELGKTTVEEDANVLLSKEYLDNNDTIGIEMKNGNAILTGTVIRKTVCSKPDTGFPSTLMQIHTNCSIYLNESLAN